MPEKLSGIPLRATALRKAGYVVRADGMWDGKLLYAFYDPTGRYIHKDNFRDMYNEPEVWECQAPAIETDIQLALRHLPISRLISVRIKYRTEVCAIEFIQEAVNLPNGVIRSISDRSICFETPDTADLAAEYCRLWLIYKDQETEIERVRNW